MASLTVALGCPEAASSRRHHRHRQQQLLERQQRTLVSQPRHRRGNDHQPRLNTTTAATAADASSADVNRLGRTPRGSTLRCRASGGKKGGPMGLFDEMLDVMEGGPKLRKWYGQDSSVGDPKAEKPEYDGGDDASKSSGGSGGGGGVDTEEDLKAWDKQPRRATLVTDADTRLGEAVVMQLIVAKQPVTALGITPEIAEARYGPYVTGEEPGWGTERRGELRMDTVLVTLRSRLVVSFARCIRNSTAVFVRARKCTGARDLFGRGPSTVPAVHEHP